MKTTLVAMLATATFATQAAALSCLRPDVASSFAAADASPLDHVVLLGTLTFDQSALPTDTMTGQETRVPATFDGMALGEGGFDRPFAGDVTLAATCAGPWCGTATSGQRILAFVAAEDGYVVEANACASMIFADPTDEQIATATACMADGC